LNLSKRIKHQTLKEHIRNEYKKYGTVKNVILEDREDNRIAIVHLSEKREVRRACEATDGRYLFNAILDVYDSSESDRHEFPFFSSRTLFIGNLEKVTTYEDLKRQFFKYGKILKIDLKKINGVTRYAFVQFAKLDDARLAVHRMQREKLGKNIVSTCYARSIKSQVLWFSGALPYRGHEIDPEFGESFFRRVFEQFGTVRSLILDRRSPKQSQILVAFSDVVGSNKAYIEFKENRRKLTNSRWSCDFASEELVQSVTDDMHKNNVLSRSEIINHWGDIIAKLKKAQEDDEFRMVGSDYEYRKYTKLSERIDRDNSAERKRYRSRDSRSRSRERYRSKRSRSRSRGRDSPRRKKSKGNVSFGRVHSPSPRRRSREPRRRGSTSSSSSSRSRSRSPESKGKKSKKRSKKSRYERKKKRSSRERKRYRDRKVRSHSESKSSSSESSSDRSTSTDRSSSRKRMMDLSEAQLEQMRKNISGELKGKFDGASYPKVTIENDHFKDKAESIEKKILTTATGNVVVKVNKPIEPHMLPLPSQKVLDEMLSAKKPDRNSRPASPLKKLPEDIPLKQIFDRRHLKDDEGNVTPTQDEEEKSDKKNLTNKKSAPIVLPVLPPAAKAKKAQDNASLTSTSPSQAASSSREKPREEVLMSPKRNQQLMTVYSGAAMGKHEKKKQMAQKAQTSLLNGAHNASDALEKEARKRKEELKKKEISIPKDDPKKKALKPIQAANPKKAFLQRAGPTKKFLEDPLRSIGEEDYDDFRKEILQALSEVRQESEHIPETEEPFIPVLQKTPPRENPSLEHLFNCNNTGTPAPVQYTETNNSERKLPYGCRVTKKTTTGSGVMEQAKIQTYLQRIIKPEEFLIDSNVKRWDIFEEDRERIKSSPWMRQDDSSESPFVAKPGVFDFYQDWNGSIETDLEQLSAAVDQVLGIGIPPNNTDLPVEEMDHEGFFPKDEFVSHNEENVKSEPMEQNVSVNGEVKAEPEEDEEQEKLKMLQAVDRRNSVKSDKEAKKEKKERTRKKSRKTSSDVEGPDRKVSREKNQSPSRKTSASSESAAQSSSPTSEILSPKPATDLDIHEVEKTNQSVRERMEDMMRRKTKGSNKKRPGKYRRPSIPENDEEKAVDDAVKNLSFEDKNESKGAEEDLKTNAADQCERNAELDAALAGLEADYEPPKIKPETTTSPEKTFETKLIPSTSSQNEEKEDRGAPSEQVAKTEIKSPKKSVIESPKKNEQLSNPTPKSIPDLPQNLFRKRFKLQERRPSVKTEAESIKNENKNDAPSDASNAQVQIPPTDEIVKAEPKPTERNVSPFRSSHSQSSVATKLSSPVKVSLPDRRHSQSEIIKPELTERVERKLSTASGTSEISNASNSGFSTSVPIQLPNTSKLETIVPPASKRYTSGPIRLAGASTTLHTTHKPTGMMAIQQPAIQTVPAPRIAVMVPRPVILSPSTPQSIPPGVMRSTMPLTTQTQIITGPRLTSSSPQVIIQRPITMQQGVINAPVQGQKNQISFVAPQTFGVRMVQPIPGRQVLVNIPTTAHSAFAGQKPAPKIEHVKSEKKSGEEKPQKQMLSFPITGSSRVPQTRPDNSVICGTALHSQRLPIPATFISPQPQQSNRPLSNDRNDRERLLDRHKLLWQGYLSIKNDTATVHLNLIHGNADVPMEFLPRATGDTSSAPPPNRMATLKIVQRMRLEQNQLDKVAEQIEKPSTCCTMVALPCGTDERDVHTQTDALQKKFIEYLKEKRSAGIVNVNSSRNPHILHIFPPCDFTTNTLRRLAPDFLKMVHHLPMLLVVIAPQ